MYWVQFIFWKLERDELYMTPACEPFTEQLPAKIDRRDATIKRAKRIVQEVTHGQAQA